MEILRVFWAFFQAGEWEIGFFFPLGGDSTGSFLGLELLELGPNFETVVPH